MENIHKRYLETTEWLFARTTSFQNAGAEAYKPGLERIVALVRALGMPQRRYKTVHVGGTNGKGSVSSLIASVLQEAGHTTGLFTSPHLLDFRERIRVDGEPITEEGVVDFIERYRKLDLDTEPSFFELTTAMAFDWFARCGCDYAVIEVGLGGRLDSTNIIQPVLSVITNISLDHTDLLGHTLEEIAREKAGIIKENTPVVIGRAEGNLVGLFAGIAEERFSLARFADKIPAYRKAEICDGMYVYEGTVWGTIECPLTGDCQPENANTVLYATAFLPGLTKDSVARGFRNVIRNTSLTGRWMKVAENPETVCDTGHNPGGWAYLGPRLAEIATRKPLHMVVGFVNDKDISSILAMMPRKARYYFTCPSVKRGRPSDELAAMAADAGLQGEAFDSVEAAYKAAREDAGPDGFVFVGGSTFVVSDLLASIEK